MNSDKMHGATAYCFDVDGTLTKSELLPCIASEIGIADEIDTLTKATINGHIEFEPSFRLRCLLLAAISPSLIQEIVSRVPLDNNLLGFIRDHKEDCFIVTGNLDIWIKPIIDQCKCQSFTSRAEYNSGKLSLQSILNKGRAIRHIRDVLGYERIVAVGDGTNDAPMLELADVGIAFGGVHAPAQAAIHASQYVIHDGGTLCNLLKML